jgi:ABC-2 type transport system ATP-binding protein
MDEPLVSVRDVKRYFGSVAAVNGVSFDLMPGTVTGFIGANGAGKTTTMRIMATLDVPNGGQVFISGIDAVQHPMKVHRMIGWMPDHFVPYPFMTVLEYLDFFGRAYNLRGSGRAEKISQVMEFTDLTPFMERPITGLSKGQAQRLCLARTLLHDPALLILDEPAAGLDPKARIEFKNAVRILREQGKTIFISSHILSELGEMCDRMIFIDQGMIIHEGSVDSLKKHHNGSITVDITVAGDSHERLLQWAELHRLVDVVTLGPPVTTVKVDVQDRDELAPVLCSAINAGVEITSFAVRERKLEDAFVDVLRGEKVNLPLPIPSDQVKRNVEV